MKKFSRKSKNYSISIITVVLNGDKYLEKSIKSTLSQNYKNYELILIDGASTDNSVKIIKKYQRKIAYWCTKKDNGIYDAMNKGIRKAKGDIIGILNSDDIYIKNALQIVNRYFQKYNQIDFLFGSVKKNRIMSGYHPHKIKWKFNIYPGHSSGFFIKKSTHDKIGLYNTKFKYSADYDLIYRMIVKHKLNGMCVNHKEVTGEFRLDGIGSRVSLFGKLIEETKIRIHNKQNIFVVITLIFLHLFNNFFYKIKSL
jgi:glycosyltransferase involved in cell wall biosynthesis